MIITINTNVEDLDSLEIDFKEIKELCKLTGFCEHSFFDKKTDTFHSNSYRKVDNDYNIYLMVLKGKKND
jgi:hypothetical protein